MGRQEELQTITTGSLGTLIQTRIAEEIETVAREKRVADQIVVVSRELVGKPSNTLDIYKRTSVKVGRVAEGGAFPTAEPTYTKLSTLRVYKEGGNSHITHEAIRDGRVDLINDCKTELGEALANRKDFLIWRDEPLAEQSRMQRNLQVTVPRLNLQYQREHDLSVISQQLLTK